MFRNNREKMYEAFPAVFLDQMEKKIPDRLPYLELEQAPFFGVTAIEGAEEGGVLAALYRLGNREEVGIQVFFDRFPFEQSTVEIAEFFGENPLEISSEGVYVMAAARAEDLAESLRSAGLPAVLLGEVTAEKKRVIIFDDEERFIEGPRFL